MTYVKNERVGISSDLINVTNIMREHCEWLYANKEAKIPREL